MPPPRTKPRRRGGEGVSPATADVAGRVGIDPWLTQREVQELLRVSKPTLLRMRQSGAFPEPVRIPGTRSIAWPASVVRAWMERAAAEAAGR